MQALVVSKASLVGRKAGLRALEWADGVALLFGGELNFSMAQSARSLGPLHVQQRIMALCLDPR